MVCEVNWPRSERESCPECQLLFAIDDIKHHECVRKSFVKIKKLKLSDSNPEDFATNSMGGCQSIVYRRFYPIFIVESTIIIRNS